MSGDEQTNDELNFMQKKESFGNTLSQGGAVPEASSNKKIQFNPSRGIKSSTSHDHSDHGDHHAGAFNDSEIIQEEDSLYDDLDSCEYESMDQEEKVLDCKKIVKIKRKRYHHSNSINKTPKSVNNNANMSITPKAVNNKDSTTITQNMFQQSAQNFNRQVTKSTKWG